MKFIDLYRDRKLVSRLSDLIRVNATGTYTFMEVCGGHTAAIHRFGIPSLLPGNIRLISGPGCPVCVTGTGYIDKAVAYSGMKGTIITTFGDLMRVPGSGSSLEKEKASGADIRVVLSAHEALSIAEKNKDHIVIFLGIGFETTAPGTAVTVKKAFVDDVSNFCIFSAHKVMPPAMEAIMTSGPGPDGFICPGHVAAVTGSSVFEFIPEKYGKGCVVSGFEPVDILLSVLMLIRQVNRKKPSTEIQYKRAVSREGNVAAREIMYEVFEPCDSDWRGMGMIHSGGLKMRAKYKKHDAEKRFPLKIKQVKNSDGCICGEILRGATTPEKCRLFAKECLPENPVGACMVSPEGACNTWYRYNKQYE